VKLWDTTTGALRATIDTAHPDGVHQVVIAPDGRRLALTVANELQVWSNEGEAVAVMRVDGQFTQCAWSPAADAVYVGGTHGLYAFELR
jgi:WD40 repeat protein